MVEGSETNPADTVREQALDAVIAAYISACEGGSPPDRRQILDAHPELAVQLRQFFAQRDRMNLLVQPIRTLAEDLFQAVGPGQQITYMGNYELLEEIARGGMGVVYKARQKTLGRIVAVKMIVSGRLATAEDVQRFQIEAKAAAGLQHPNIVSIHEVGQHEGWHYFSMDYVDGRDLSAILRENLLPAKQAATYVRQMAEAIHYAHQQGTLHRDLKPSNVLIDRQDHVRITDFGLAMRVEGGSDLTRTGQIVGTPSYMPPEQAEAKRGLIGSASDVYSLGAILYECLTGRAPFRADSVLKTIQQVIHVEAASPRLLNPTLPRDLETICLKCLEKEPHRRYGTAQLLADDLGRYLRGEPISARPLSRPARLWRWCRRKPLVASLTASLLFALVTVAVISSLAYVRERVLSMAIIRALDSERQSKDEATHRLYRSLVAQARANRLSRRIGQRFESLAVLREASRMAHEMSLPETNVLELRNEAIACLTLADVKAQRDWPGWPSGSLQMDLDRNLERSARVDREGNISVRRVADDAELWNLNGLGTNESWPALSPDGQFLIVWNGRFKLWNLSGPTPTVIAEGTGHSPAFRADSRQLALPQQNSFVHIFDLPSGLRLKELAVETPPGRAIYHPHERKLAVSSSRGIRLWDVESGKALGDLPHAGAHDMTWHPAGHTLAAVVSGRMIQLWDIGSGKPTVQLKGHTNDGIVPSFSQTGNLIASTGWGQPLRLWDPRTGELLFQTPGAMLGMHFSEDDRQLGAILTIQGRLQILDLAPVRDFYRTVVRDPVQGPGTYHLTSVSPDGRLLAGGMDDGVGLWDFVSGNMLKFLSTGRHFSVLFEPSGALLTSGPSGVVRWPITIDSPESQTVRMGTPEPLPLRGPSNRIALGNHGQVLAKAVNAGGLVWHLDPSQPPIPLSPHDDARYIDVSSDGRWIATGSHAHTKVKIWDGHFGKLLRELPVEGTSQVVFSPDGRWLVTSYHGNRLWSTDSWQEVREFGGSGGIAFSPDSNILAIELGNGIIRLLDPATGCHLAQLEDPHQDRSYGLTFTPDGSQLVAMNNDSNSIHIWNLRAIRAELAEMNLDWNLPAYPKFVSYLPLSLAPSPAVVDPDDLCE